MVQRRLGPGGAVQYRVHYDGWKKRWDEWVARDSGRIRSELPATNPPRKIDSKAKAKAGKEAGRDKDARGSQVLPHALPLAVPSHSRHALAASAPHRCACAAWSQKGSSSSSGGRKSRAEAGPSEAAADDDADE